MNEYQIRENDRVRYFDKNGKELTDGCKVKYPDGTIKKVYLTEEGNMGTDATNPAWIESGRAVPCEYGVYPFEYNETKDLEIVEDQYTPSEEEIMDKKNFKIILDIVSRADKLNLLMFDRLSLIMDIEEADRQFNLRLEDWLAADDYNFAHDVVGIQKNINRDTKDFNFFIPRFAKN